MVDPFRLVDTEINGIRLSIPVIVQELFEFIHQEIVEGIFRINGSLKKVNYYYTNLTKYNKWLPTANVYDICSLLKKLLLNNFKFFLVENIDLAKLFGNVSEADGSDGKSDENQITEFNWNYFNHLMNNQLKEINLNVFIYITNFLHNFLLFNKITKMSVLNFAIIFQPICFPCENFVLLPHYINLLKHLLENKSKILINKSLINEKLSYDTNLLDPELESNTLFYKFKNFKNKSIDSINISRRDYFKYSKFGKSVESLPAEVPEPQDESENPFKDQPVNAESETNKSETDPSELLEMPVSDLPMPDNVSELPVSELPVSDTNSASSHEDSDSKTFFNEVKDNSYYKHPSLVNSKSFHCREELYQDESFQSLDPLDLESHAEKGQDHRYGTKQFKPDSQSVDPLLVDPEVNELVKLQDVNTKSFQFDIDFDNSSNSSFHSIVNLDSDEGFDHDATALWQSESKTSQDASYLTNDTSYRPDQLDGDINFNDAKTPMSSSPNKKRYSNADILSSINTFTKPSPNVANAKTKTKPRNSPTRSPTKSKDVQMKRSSRILTKIESKLSLDPVPSFISTSSPTQASPKRGSTPRGSTASISRPQSRTQSESSGSQNKRNSILDNSKNLISMFKNENPKRNFSMKLKSKSVF